MEPPVAAESGSTDEAYCVNSKYFVVRRQNGDTAFRYRAERPIFSYYSRLLQPVSWRQEQREKLVQAVQSYVRLGFARGNMGDTAEIADRNATGIEYQCVDWEGVASAVGGEVTARECLMQYRNVDDPRIHHQPWSETEIEALANFVREHGNNWATCAEAVGNNRTPFQCISFYQQCLNNNIAKRDEWTEHQDFLLKRAVGIYNADWTNVSNFVDGRTPKQCHQRWERFVRPSAGSAGGVKKGAWSAGEERRLYLAAVALNAPTAKSTPEDRRSFPGWKKLAEFVPTRDGMQCREKWSNVLDPYLNRGAFTNEEDELIQRFCEEMAAKPDGEDSGFWSKVAVNLPNRTDNQIFRRWKELTDASTKHKYLEQKRLQKRYMPAAHGRRTKGKTDTRSYPIKDEQVDIVLYSHQQDSFG